MNKQMTAYSRVLPGILVYIQIPEYTDQNAIADDSECILPKLIKQITDHTTGEFGYEMYWNYRSNER